MKIVYVLSGTEINGGATKSFLNLLNGAIKDGCECLVICPRNNGIYTLLKDKGVETYYLPYRFNISKMNKNGIFKIIEWFKWKRRQFVNIRTSIQLYSICKSFNPDIIHSNTSVTNIGCLVAKKMGIPHITHFREYGDIDFGMIIHNLKDQINYKQNYNISITQSIAEYRQLPPDRSKVIYNGICSEDEIRFNENKDSYILYAGRIQKTKGIEDLISAYIIYCKAVKNPLCLKIAGSYASGEGMSIKRESQEIISDAGITDRVEWIGEVDMVKDLMMKATATIVPSLNEGFGRVMPEAMANGSLVIGRDTGGTKEQFDNGIKICGNEIGMRFNNILELASILEEITKKGVMKYYDMIRNSQEVVRQLYTTEKYVMNIMDYYNYIKSCQIEYV